MNVLKIFKLNFGIVDDRLGCLDDILGKNHPLKTALVQYRLTDKKRFTILLTQVNKNDNGGC